MTRRTTTVSGLLISAASFAILAVLLLSAELLARAWFAEDCAHLEWESARIDSARRYLAPCPAPESREGVARIAVVGASSADLLAQRLETRLGAPECGGRYEVLNCAQSGSALEHVERRFDEVVEFEPDVVVLLFGHNILFRFELDQAQLRLQAIRAHSCLISQLAPRQSELAVPLDDRLAVLEAFLRRAASATRARGIALVVATMPANLWIPLGMGHDDQYDPRFLEARFLAARGRHDEAIHRLEALSQGKDLSHLHYQLGEQLAQAGHTQRAYRELHLALDGDSLGLRAPKRLNDLIRRVAAQEGLLLRDTELEIESRAPTGLPGWESFIDNCHLRPVAIDREVDELLALLHEAPLGLPPVCDAKPDRNYRKGLRDVLIGVFNLAASAPTGLAQRWYLALSLAVES